MLHPGAGILSYILWPRPSAVFAHTPLHRTRLPSNFFGPALLRAAHVLPQRQQVVHIDMYDKPSAVPRELVNYHPSMADTAARPWRTDIKPLHVVQPEVRTVTDKSCVLRAYVY